MPPVYLREPGATRTVSRSGAVLAELFGEPPEHRGSGEFQLRRPGGMIHRDDELAATNELRTDLASDLRSDDRFPAARHLP